MNLPNVLRKPTTIIIIVVVIGAILLSVLAYQTINRPKAQIKPTPTATATPTIAPTPTLVPTPTATTTLLPAQNPADILGVDGTSAAAYTGIPWLRMGYPTCGWGNLRGDVLKSTMEAYHKQGVRVLLTVCQPSADHLFDTQLVQDVAQGNPDAVQCGNEEMKQDPSVAFLYVPPANFAKFYDLCEKAVHAVRSDTPVLLGSLDPHVGGIDYQPLLNQVSYLNQMQAAMNTTVHPGGNWDWHNQTLGLIDSWHNGWSGGRPNSSVNSLYGLLSFWSQQFNTDLNSGDMGKHIWVVEGTGCFKGCGVNSSSSYDVAASHVVTMTTDVQTATKYKVPFFYFSGKDFFDQGITWPIGVLDTNDNPKPLRQDLPMGARTLTLSCSNGSVTVQDQLQLLAHLYAHCSLPNNYAGLLAS